MSNHHITVLLHEAVEGLAINPSGIYLDGTFGRGGHSRLILSKLGPEGKLFAIDRDPRAIESAKEIQDSRFCILHGNFSQAKELLEPYGVIGRISGILLDLGVSSPQLDEPTRGFSFMHDGPLDMRMNPNVGESAAQWLQHADVNDIAYVLKEYGEEKFAKKIANIIVNDRVIKPFTTTKQLADMISRVVPRTDSNKHPATRSFQAIRIYINRELEEIKQTLVLSKDLLQDKGRLAVISFHSLEDRIVKNFIRDSSRGDVVPRGLPVQEKELLKSRTFKAVSKPIKPSDEEIAKNPRSRSAILRIAERFSVEK
jgi:16S rRNA (cytosine1402-N4)-methyltransferase